MVVYLFVLIILFILELLYFKIADRYNIIDKPNERSSHSQITLRGGGVIFYLAALLYFVWSDFQYPWFFLGLTFMSVVSFADDILTLSNKARLLVHFGSVLLMGYELQIFTFPWYYLLIAFVVIVGVINAYNFMDGINGITASYSIAVCGLLLWVNTQIHFIDPDLLWFSLIGLVVFSFFNFRDKAKCFAGDVGSVSIAFILLFALGKLILQTGNLIYILFLTVYGIDAVWTILRRLYLKENIFEAHRSHLYQYLGNEAGVNKLLISFLYGLVQFVIGIGIIWVSSKNTTYQFFFAASVIFIFSGGYLIFKSYIINKYVKPRNQLLDRDN
jgi:UDP-GlcNAc:undecaprenyl-phosphate GlcNAc-1-phosphate transferase